MFYNVIPDQQTTVVYIAAVCKNQVVNNFWNYFEIYPIWEFCFGWKPNKN